MQFAVGFKFQGKTGHVVVDAEDALIAALKVKMQRPEALIAYVRQQNKRGDTRHPMRRFGSESPKLRLPHLTGCKQSPCEIAFTGVAPHRDPHRVGESSDRAFFLFRRTNSLGCFDIG